ncbi:MAG TPA: hypothetical protein VGV85_14110 [Longimicrobiaceae bacterium]|nr:hypothetical protein [Longimicrobiaceae bacterium]
MGNVVVYLTEPGNAAAAQAARASLSPLLAGWNAGVPVRRVARQEIIIREGKYTFEQLREFRDRASLPILAVDGVVFVDLDEAQNRVLVALDRSRVEGVGGQVRSVVAAWGIPEDAVVFEGRSPIMGGRSPGGPPPADDPGEVTVQCTDPNFCPTRTYLYSKVRPLRGGLKVEYEGPAGYNDRIPCTLGLPVRYYGTPMFIVNSHCTRRRAKVDLDRFYQPTLYTESDYVGSENADPVWSLNGFASVTIDGSSYACNDDNDGTSTSGMYCRRSDAALVEAYGGLSEGSIDFGYIARTTNREEALGYSGSKEILSFSNRLKVTSEDGDADRNEILDKIGSSTGWTSGAVGNDCVDVRWPKSDPYSTDPSNTALRCQTFVAATAYKGDSGAPVFKWNGDGTVVLYGILWAWQAEGFFFSSIDLIRLDLQLSIGSQTLQTVFP